MPNNDDPGTDQGTSPYGDLSPSDRDYLIRTVIGEAGNDPGSAPGVAHVVLNRLASGQYGNSIPSVVLAPNQFESWDRQNLMSYAPTSPQYQQAAKVVDGVLSGAPDPTNGATKFYAPAAQTALGRQPPSWDDGSGVMLGKQKFFGGSPVSSDFLTDFAVAPAASSGNQATPAPDVSSSDIKTLDMSPAQFEASQTAQKAPSADFLTDFAVAPSGTMPASNIGNALPAPPPGYSASGQPVSQDLAAEASFLNGVPIVGPYLKNGILDAAAWLRSKVTGEDQNQLSAAMNRRVNASEAAYPTTSTASGIGGGIVGTIPAIAAAPAAFGISGAGLVPNALMSAGTGAAIGGLDSGARSDWNLADMERGAKLGGGLGLFAPAVGNAIGGGVNALSNILSRTTPSARSLSGIISDIGMSPEYAQNALAQMGPHATLADVDPALTTEASGLASLGGSPTSILKNAMNARSAGSDARLSQLVTNNLGPSPDVDNILEGIRSRESDLAYDPATARSALDDSMGRTSDPYTQFHNMVKSRSAAAQPLYEKAFRGGSMAPLEKQFEGAFSDSTNAVSQASKDLASAQQAQLLAKAKISNAGENVYGMNGAMSADREAQSSVQEAEQNLAQAEKSKADVLARLRQAQQDGSMNKPGAVWNPRIQQFLDDPIMQSGLAKGMRIQRLESLADGKPFNPTEYAITGFNEAGDPIVGGVPNMRTLNVAKKGLDSMVDAAKDPLTGRLSEEGRAIDKVRSSFLSELDQVNPDYKAARAAWGGPSQAQDSFNRGLGLFRNQAGPSGVNSTPGALDAWMKTASDSDKEAAKAGARAAFEQQMANSSDPGAKAASIVNREANQAKLASILGPDEAQKLTNQLNFRYEDPIGAAFSKGMDVFKARQGVEGIQDTPNAWSKLISNASPAELDAYKQGARQAIEQSLTSARQGDLSAARSLFAKASANRAKLDMLFPNAQKMLDGLDNELQMRTNANDITRNAATAERRAVQSRYAPAQGGGQDATAAILGSAADGLTGGLALTGARAAFNGFRNAITEGARNRLIAGSARGLAATGQERDDFIGQLARAHRTNAVTNALASGSSGLANLLTRNAGNALLPQHNQ